jgi:(2Fe-2S) ferredoxin
MTIQKLNQIRDQYKANIEQRKIHQEESYKGKYQVLVCASTGCIANKGLLIIDKFNEEIKKHNLQDKVDVVPTGCHGLCEMGPVVIVYPQGAFYAKIKVEDVEKIVTQHLIGNKVVTEKLF